MSSPNIGAGPSGVSSGAGRRAGRSPKGPKGEAKEPLCPLDQHERIEWAIRLLRAGMRTAIVTAATRLRSSRVRKLHRALFNREAQCGMLPFAYSLLSTHRAIEEASLAIGLYLDMAGPAALDPLAEKSPCLSSLLDILPIYERLVPELEIGPVALFDINGLWILANNLKYGSIKLHRCNCGMEFVWSEQQRVHPQCPVCSAPVSPEAAFSVASRRVRHRSKGSAILAQRAEDLQHVRVASPKGNASGLAGSVESPS
ncbi:hypothetical protein FZ983_27640 [Azospirillum sp. B21]|nr:hypothetical protein FZ983_27640 [Azospirillum sp. B21]